MLAFHAKDCEQDTRDVPLSHLLESASSASRPPSLGICDVIKLEPAKSVVT